jgi:hypothetical protein
MSDHQLNRRGFLASLSATSILATELQLDAADSQTADLIVYGGTSAGIGAAIQAARMGKSVIVIEPGRHIGGLTTGGLGYTDSGNKAVVGGIAREFYRLLKKHYADPSNWKYDSPKSLKNYRAEDDAIWVFEPSVAEKYLRQMSKSDQITFQFGQRLDRSAGKGIKKAGSRIESIKMESGEVYSGKIFIDATYEGDLMAAAGVSYTTGREPADKYSEKLAGWVPKLNTKTHRFKVNVDPYVIPGDKSSGLLFGIAPGPYPADGSGDNRLQAYCFRMCMSNVEANRVPFPKPSDYDEKLYELLFRNFEAGDMRLPLKIDMVPNGKTDTNNNYAVSTDFIGQNYNYPDASYAEREAMIRRHESYQKGLMWSLANHPRVPAEIREKMKIWGLAKDEFTDNGNWPHQIYVREARRMVSDYVMTENDCRRTRQTPESIGMGSYNMDSHNCTRYVTAEGYVQNEGDVQVSPGGPYKISYRAIVPKRDECTNLLVPVCLSSSHMSYGSIRMEPVFIILGQSAATAACMAIDANISVQEVPYDQLKQKLLADGQVLEYAPPPAKKSQPQTTKKS